MSVERKNILLHDVTESLDYKSPSAFGKSNYPQRNRRQHADFITRRLERCRNESLTQRQVAAIHYKDGMYLEFSGKEGYDLVTKSLENKQQGIRLLNIQERRIDDSEEIQTVATVYVPAGKEAYFLKRITEYATKENKSGRPKHSDFIESIEDIKTAYLSSFWLDKKEDIPKENPEFCEIWLRFEVNKDNMEETPWKDAEVALANVCNNNQIYIDDKRIVFPERLVKLIRANEQQLKIIINECDYVAEIHKAPVPNQFFTSMNRHDQTEWVQDLLERTNVGESGVTVCLLDSGITQEHPLIRPFVDDAHVLSYDSDWGTRDINSGHGTEMAGIAIFNDLTEALETSEKIDISHKIESVKILPNNGQNPEGLYGAIIKDSISEAEIVNPTANRVICMAVTAPDDRNLDGKPSSWSAAIDEITSGSLEEDVKRLFIVSAGNVTPNELNDIRYPDSSVNHPVEDPGQSWNALTVGAYCGNRSIINTSSFSGFTPVTEPGDLSPYSSTSLTWSSKWPIKPEILFDGGNMMTNGSDYDSCPDLSLLTTNQRFMLGSSLFTETWGTSSASAQAANFAARIYEVYPDAWPETVRALMVHSAEWTDKMKKTFMTDDKKSGGRRRLLRSCGYGIPSLDRALQCMKNSVNMIIQAELQPFSNDKMKEMHFHTLPWPKELLESLGNVTVRMRVTLSYFIDPAPGEIGWKDRYRYPSCGLRFDVNNADQGKEDFQKSINIKMRDDEKSDKGDGTSGTSRWFLGTNNRDVGSIHSDFIECSAIDLCDCNYVAVFPVIGWWRERRYLGCSENKIRYSLIISLSTPDVSVDLYTPIITKIENPITIIV